jgi:hypothetical protein
MAQQALALCPSQINFTDKLTGHQLRFVTAYRQSLRITRAVHGIAGKLIATTRALSSLAQGSRAVMPVVFDLERTRKLLMDLKGANTEAAKKERFGQYLTLTFAGDTSAQQVISKIALGAEQIVVNIPRGPSAQHRSQKFAH